MCCTVSLQDQVRCLAAAALKHIYILLFCQVYRVFGLFWKVAHTGSMLRAGGGWACKGVHGCVLWAGGCCGVAGETFGVRVGRGLAWAQERAGVCSIGPLSWAVARRPWPATECVRQVWVPCHLWLAALSVEAHRGCCCHFAHWGIGL
jgi:hypothetical protein